MLRFQEKKKSFIFPLLKATSSPGYSSLRGYMPEKLTFLRNWHPVRGLMSFAAKGKRKRVKKG